MHWCLWIAYLGLVNIHLAEGAGKEDSRAVIGRIGESVVLKCDLLPHDEARPPHYVIEWVRFGFLLPIFIKFGLYSPRVDPEYLEHWRTSFVTKWMPEHGSIALNFVICVIIKNCLGLRVWGLFFLPQENRPFGFTCV